MPIIRQFISNENPSVEEENLVTEEKESKLSNIEEEHFEENEKESIISNFGENEKELKISEEAEKESLKLVTDQILDQIDRRIFSKKEKIDKMSSKRSSIDGSLFDLTEDEDSSSVILPDDNDGRIRKRSISYDNPELVKLIRNSGKFKVQSDAQLSALSEDSGLRGASSLPLFWNNSEGRYERNGAADTLAEEEREENAAPASAAVAAVEMVYEMFKDSENGKVSIRKFLNALTANGIRTTDPRLDESMHALNRITKRFGTDFDSANILHLGETEFKNVIRPNAMTISRFLRTNFVIPEWNEFCRHIFRLYGMCKNNSSGETSDMIPLLASCDKNLWGISLCSVDGQRFSLGDFNVPFCLQAASRVLNYAIALNDLGAEKVHSYVGQEPSGRKAKELVLDSRKKPHNPMINAGAIVITALLKAEEKHMADRFEAVHNLYKKMAGRNEFIGFCNQAYLSERQVAYRNYAMGYFLRENQCLPQPERLNETLELMLQFCAVEASCESLAVMAATLANGGVCPITGEYVIGSHCVRDVLSLMYTTGMNDYSGQFAFHVGLPAKSSISGAIMLVIPNVMGIALWSPPLDHRSNSVRGIQFCTELVKVFNFHNYDNLRFTQRKLDPRKMHVENKAHQVVLTLFSAANGDVTALTRFYLQGVDLTVADYDRRTPLHIAAAEGHMHCVKFLVEKARVPSRPVDRWNNTPADDARYHNHPEIAEYLENWDLRRGSALSVPHRLSQPAIHAFTAGKLDGKQEQCTVRIPDGYEASRSETEEETSDSGQGSSRPSNATSPNKGN